MTEPFVDDQGELVEREQSAVERELRLIKTMNTKFNTAMSALHAVGRTLTQHGDKDMNSLLCAIKVTDLNSKLIAAAQEWLRNRGVAS
ncbi:MAG: hypothetical protein KAJ42_15450 [Gemmatimonadetes bacterium]|nr:hypothetical protein [Gemmatimonadota bacterium]